LFVILAKIRFECRLASAQRCVPPPARGLIPRPWGCSQCLALVCCLRRRPLCFCSNVYARACFQRQGVWNASSCRPAGVDCRLSCFFRATVSDLVRPVVPPAPPPMCADRGAQSRRPLPRPCGGSCESTDGDDAGAHFPLRPRACTYLHVYIHVRVLGHVHGYMALFHGAIPKLSFLRFRVWSLGWMVSARISVVMSTFSVFWLSYGRSVNLFCAEEGQNPIFDPLPRNEKLCGNL